MVVSVDSSADACFAAPPLWSAVGLDAAAAAASAVSALGRSLGQLAAAALALAGEVEHPAGTTTDAQPVCWVCQRSLPDRAYTALHRSRGEHNTSDDIRVHEHLCSRNWRVERGTSRSMYEMQSSSPACNYHAPQEHLLWESNAAHCGRLWHIWRVQSDTGAHKHLDVSLRRDNTVGTATVNDAVGLAPGMQEQLKSR